MENKSCFSVGRRILWGGNPTLKGKKKFSHITFSFLYGLSFCQSISFKQSPSRHLTVMGDRGGLKEQTGSSGGYEEQNGGGC